MCTFLELQEKLMKMMLSSDAIKKSEIIFLEGYLWDEGRT
jgi:fructokinase